MLIIRILCGGNQSLYVHDFYSVVRGRSNLFAAGGSWTRQRGNYDVGELNSNTTPTSSRAVVVCGQGL